MPERTSLPAASTLTGLPPHRKQPPRKGALDGHPEHHDSERDSPMPPRPLLILPSHPSRIPLSRIDSTASTVLPPQVDTTEARVLFSGNATLMSLNSLITPPHHQQHDSDAVHPPASPSNHTIPTSNVPSKSPHAAASPSQFVKTLHSLGTSSRNATPPQPQKLPGHPPSTQPKPMVPGFITTCGSVPVVSKFLGPRAAPAGRSSRSPPDGVRCSPDSTSATTTTTTTTARKAGAENSGTLGRIQKKLLMERDRPISPLSDSSPPTPAGPPPSVLPPPSYLIRSLGGQTGPLPFIPLNLLPPDPPLPLLTPSTCNISLQPPLLPDLPPRLNEPALKAKQALSIKLWRNSLIDEVEQVLTDHESNIRFRNPLFESFLRVSSSSCPPPCR